jgi:3D (Asp-Asp-Asp) domain-containing protein
MRNCSQTVSAFCVLLAIAAPAFAGRKQEKIDRIETRVESKPIKAPVVYQFSRNVGPGRLVKAQEGTPGKVTRTFEVQFSHGKPVSKRMIKETKVEAVPTIFAMGRSGFQSDRGTFARHKVLTMSATAYDPSPQTIGRGATGRTATGRRATYGVVAVDPRVIPLGTLLFVEGYGLALACDTGGAIKGNRIDLCYDSRSTANAFGRKNVRVHILKTR